MHPLRFVSCAIPGVDLFTRFRRGLYRDDCGGRGELIGYWHIILFKWNRIRTAGPEYNTVSMTRSTPKKITWIIGLGCGILGIIGHFTYVQTLTEYNYIFIEGSYPPGVIGKNYFRLLKGKVPDD